MLATTTFGPTTNLPQSGILSDLYFNMQNLAYCSLAIYARGFHYLTPVQTAIMAAVTIFANFISHQSVYRHLNINACFRKTSLIIALVLPPTLTLISGVNSYSTNCRISIEMRSEINNVIFLSLAVLGAISYSIVRYA